MNNDEVLLIDGNALMYKAFYASYFLLQKGSGYDDFNRPINALRTFSTMILNLVDSFETKNILVAFDQKGVKTYRTEHDFYKAGRSKMPEELIFQKPLIEKVLDLSGIKHYSSVDYEADDIIGILSKKYSNLDKKVNVITADKDLLQLVDHNVKVFISKTGVSDMLEYNNSNFVELSGGLNPSQIKDLKGVAGDSSDNLIGIKGIGEKGAIKLLCEYNSLEGIINNVNKLTPGLQKKVNEGKDMAILCKSIATIITEDELNISYEETMIRGDFNKKELVDFLREYSIHSVANKLEQRW